MAAASRGAALLPLLLLAALMMLESCSSLPEDESMMFETGNSPATGMLVSGGGGNVSMYVRAFRTSYTTLRRDSIDDTRLMIRCAGCCQHRPPLCEPAARPPVVPYAVPLSIL
eukprot:8072300-Pyramimonas_sp.AAC.1